jgi:hypothetical protein
LLCPFGCRREHRRQAANQRSLNHYQTPLGKRNKKQRNGRRSGHAPSCQEVVQPSLLCAADVPAESSSPDAEANPPSAAATLSVIQSSRIASVEDSATSNPDLGEAIPSASAPSTLTPASAEHTETTPSSGDGWWVLQGVRLNEASVVHSPLLSYARRVASQIEGRVVGREELVQALLQTMRQRSLGSRSRAAYVLDYLHQHPP